MAPQALPFMKSPDGLGSVSSVLSQLVEPPLCALGLPRHLVDFINTVWKAKGCLEEREYTTQSTVAASILSRLQPVKQMSSQSRLKGIQLSLFRDKETGDSLTSLFMACTSTHNPYKRILSIPVTRVQMAFTHKHVLLTFSSLWEGSYFHNSSWIASIFFTLTLEMRMRQCFRTHWGWKLGVQ